MMNDTLPSMKNATSVTKFYISICIVSKYFSGCQFPSSWQGIWFQQGVRPYITIDQDSISSKGWCHVIEGGHVMVANTSPSSQVP